MNFFKPLVAISALWLSSQAMVFGEPYRGGEIVGHVVDELKNSLPGAEVSIDDRQWSITTDLDGKYRIQGIDPGSHTLVVSYLGFSPVTRDILVKDGEALTCEIVLKENTQMLDEVVVKGVFSEQRQSINRQRANMNVTNVVSSEQSGKFPDSNIGDALKRISGINVQYDQGEARFGQIRGTAADLTSVTVNGSRLPSAEGETRCVQLDLIPTDMIQTIEVNKVAMPDQDGDAIGGSINLVTKSAPNRFFAKAFAGTGYNWIRRKPSLNFGLTLGNRFFDGKLGVTVAASYQNAPNGSYDTEFVWEKDDNGNAYVNEYQIRKYYVTRERQSYSLSLDYNINPNHSLYFKGLFNNRNDWENRYRTTIKDLTPEGDGTVRVQTKGGTPDNRDARLERQQTMDFSLGGNHKVGIFEIDWNGGYARASEERPNERYIDYQLKDQQFVLDISNPREPFATPVEGSTMTLNDNFSLKELTQQQEDIKEEDLKFSVDLETNLGSNSKLKFGAKIVNKTKRKEIDFYEYTPLDEDGFNANAFGNLTDEYDPNFMPTDRYNPGIFVDKSYLGSLQLDDASQFEKQQVAEELAANYKARETVSSGFVRFDTRLADNVELMAGLRAENTALKYTGRIYDDETDMVSTTDPETSNYINFLPSLLLKWEACKDYVIRTSYTQTLSRPKYSALVPGMTISRGDNEIKLGNPNLKATTSHNFDIHNEYYFKSIGLVGMGLFYKKIENFIIDETRFNAEYLGQTWDKITQPKNAGNANLFGIEMSLQRDFGFITPALKCIGFYGTYTYTHSRVSDFNFEGRENETGLRLPGSPKHTANASLYFEKAGVNLRLSYNYASAFIDEMGTSAFYDRYYDSVNYLDLNLSYTFGKKLKWTVYAEANNLLNQPLRYYQGSKDYTMQAEYYGVKVNGGIKLSF